MRPLSRSFTLTPCFVPASIYEARPAKEQKVGDHGQLWKTEYGLAAPLALFALNALVIIITSSCFPPEEFHHFSQDSLAGGLGRALVFADVPVVLIAVATTGVSVVALRTSRYLESPERRRVLGALDIVAVACCLMTAFPRVADAGDLDAEPVNSVPLVGVAIAIILSMLALRDGNWPVAASSPWRDRVSVAIVAVLAAISLPWIVPNLGSYIDDIPLIVRLFIASEIPAGETLAAVHPGHHHGLEDGLLFVTSALVLNHLTRNWAVPGLAAVRSVYRSLMFSHVAFNLANDAWREQTGMGDVGDSKRADTRALGSLGAHHR